MTVASGHAGSVMQNEAGVIIRITTGQKGLDVNATGGGVDMQLTGDWMPNDYITFRFEFNHRFANVPYFSGSGGVTPPGGNNGNPSALIPGWNPDLVKEENRLTWAMLVRY